MSNARPINQNCLGYKTYLRVFVCGVLFLNSVAFAQNGPMQGLPPWRPTITLDPLGSTPITSGSGSSQPLRGPTRTNLNSPGYSSSLGGNTPDQVLSERSGQLFFYASDFSSPGGDSNAPLRAFLQIGGTNPEVFELGTAQAAGSRSRQIVRVSEGNLANLFQRHSFGLATLVIKTSAGQTLEPINSRAPRVYIGGTSFDRNCEHPLLITDFHGTLDNSSGDSGLGTSERDPNNCIETGFGQLLVDHPNLVVFVVSTRGAEISGSLSGLPHSDRILALDVVSEFSGGSAEEKTIRILNQVYPSNACILGFSSEDVSREGRVASALNLPYLGVNQIDRPGTPVYQDRLVPYCALVLPRDQQQTSLSTSGDCPEGYVLSPPREYVSCESYGTPPVQNNHWGRFCPFDSRQIGEVQMSSATCTSNLVPRIPMPASNSCPANYASRTERRPVEVSRSAATPSFEVQRLPAGSLYTHNWCELSAHLRQRMQTIHDDASQRRSLAR